VVGASLLFFTALALVSWAYILLGDSGFPDLFRSDTWRGAADFVTRLLGRGIKGTPAYLDAQAWREAARLSVETLAMSVLAMGIAGVGALLTFLPAARSVAFGQLSGSRSIAGPGLFFVVRALFAFTRGIPELLWAMLAIFVLSPGILPSAVALGVHNYGILGKLSAELVENLDPRPARALRAAGAGNLQMLMYGIVPQVLPPPCAGPLLLTSIGMRSVRWSSSNLPQTRASPPTMPATFILP
jgi:phosphonate transport system permease protein